MKVVVENLVYLGGGDSVSPLINADEGTDDGVIDEAVTPFWHTAVSEDVQELLFWEGESESDTESVLLFPIGVVASLCCSRISSGPRRRSGRSSDTACIGRGLATIIVRSRPHSSSTSPTSLGATLED